VRTPPHRVLSLIGDLSLPFHSDAELYIFNHTKLQLKVIIKIDIKTSGFYRECMIRVMQSQKGLPEGLF
jgi:hypothetical protein